jgi:hypothetical protein
MKRKKNSSNSSAQFCPDVSFGNINYLDLSLKQFDVQKNQKEVKLITSADE